MDGIKVGSARIYQLFSSGAGESSSRDNNSSQSPKAIQAQNPNPVQQNTDAVRISPAVQQEQAARNSRVQEIKQQVQSGEYQKQLKNPTTTAQVAKSIVEFYSA